MSAAYEKVKAEMGNMDDMQFNASLDALLDGENMNEEDSSGSNPFPVPQSLNMQDSIQSIRNIRPSKPMEGLIGVSTGGLEPESAGMGGPLPIGSYSGASICSLGSYPGLTSYGSLGNPSRMYTQTQPAEYITSFDASSVASSTPSGCSKTTSSRSRRRRRDLSAVSEDEGDHGRRKHDRNMREQQRSQKITKQIDHLKEILSSANVDFKPDKYSTLVSVADYIQHLQERSALLDVEHRKLIDTISRTNEMVNEQYIPTSTNGAHPPGSGKLDQAASGAGNDQGAFLPNIDYRNIFSRCNVPLAILSIDGRFLDCNHGFERLSGYTREELLLCEHRTADGNVDQTDETLSEPSAVSRNLSLFNLLSREHMEAVFLAMSEMLRQTPGLHVDEKEDTIIKDYWCGTVCLSRNTDSKLRMNVSLVRSPRGQAKYFDCSLTLVDE